MQSTVAAGLLTPPPAQLPEDPDEGATRLPELGEAGRHLPPPEAQEHDEVTGVITPRADGASPGLTPQEALSASADVAETRVPPPPDPDVTKPPPPSSQSASRPSGVRRTSGVRTPSSAGRPAVAGRASGPLAIGEEFGPRYHIIRVLGVGGMGAVYQAWDAELSMAVAVKVIRPEIAADPIAAREIERRFKRELLLARQVTHKNVVRIHDLGEIDGIKYITMPFVEGRDLATILKRQHKLEVRRALRIARGIVSGLVSAHEAGVVHRDLKPANIMVGEDDEPTIMDFGIARSSGQDAQGAASPAKVDLSEAHRPMGPLAGGTMVGTIVGTVEYMAPEQAKGEAVDQRADIYAFGLILYDMLIGGRRSERAESAIAELQRRMAEPPRAPRALDQDIPKAVDAIILRCLAPDAAKRFQTTAELQAALNRLDDNGKQLPIYRRVSRRAMVAAALLVTLLPAGTFFATRWLTAPVRTPDPVSVVIADVQNTTGDPTFDNTIGQTLRRALEDASFISAFDRSRMAAAGVRPPEKMDEVTAREIAVKQGLGVVLAASIAPSGGGYEIAVKATQTVTGNEIISTSERASSKDQVLETAASLMARVRRVLGDTTSESAQLFAMRSVSASSLEVLSHYAAGVEAQARGRFEDARTSLSRAVELDPNFGLGYQGLSAMAATLGQRDEATKYMQEALRHVDGLTERERFFTRGAYYRLAGDYRNCAKEYAELLSRYPADAAARAQRAACLVFLRNPREALAETQAALKTLPNHAAFRMNLVLTAYRAGEFQLVEDEVKATPQPDPRVLLALAYSQMGRGLIREAEETYTRVAAADPKNAWARSGLGDILVYEGRFSEAIPIFEEAADADLAGKNALRAAIKLLSAASAHLQRGQRGPAAAAADKALQQSTAMAVRFLAAQIFVETGALDKAQRLAAELASSTEPSDDSRVHGQIIEAQIALQKKDAPQAIKILTAANNVLDTWVGHFNLGRAYLQAGMFVQADSEFDLCITRRGEALTMMDEGPTFGLFPLVYYYQGRVREEMKTASFADSYREYLKIRGASKEDPLLTEVRKRAGN